MTIIKLKELKIKNFKGIENADFDFEGKSVSGFGDNATGKSTLFDAWQWVLFDKNATGQSKFGIKPMNPDGSEKHFLDTEVEVILFVNDRPMKLRKITKEVWTKKHGEADRTFSGHTTDYYVNDTPTKQSDYKKIIANELVEENTFKMLTNVYAFNELDWKLRRNLVLSLTKNYNDEDILKSDSRFNVLVDDLKIKPIEDIIKTERDKRLRLNTELKTLPARIDELSSIDFKDLEGRTPESVEDEIAAAQNKLEEINLKKTSSGFAQEIKEIEFEIKVKEEEKFRLENDATDPLEKEKETLTKEGRVIESEIANLKLELGIKENQLKAAESEEKRLNDLKEILYEEYDEVEARKFTADKCDYCGQLLPSEKLEELTKTFNRTKVDHLKAIKSKGQEINKKIVENNTETSKLINVVASIQSDLVEKNASLEAKRQEWIDLNSQEIINPNQAKINNLSVEIEEGKKQLKELQDKSTTDISLQSEEEIANNNLRALAFLLGRFKQLEETKKRIEELKKQEKQASSNLSQYEHKINVAEDFIAKKAELLEKEINNHFTTVKFKLFNTLVHGGVEETCIATVDGVDFNDLNTAKKVNAGLDIIKSLQFVYKVKAPIFIDNAESVVEYIDLEDTQFIKLYVVKGEKKLRFESEV